MPRHITQVQPLTQRWDCMTHAATGAWSQDARQRVGRCASSSTGHTSRPGTAPQCNGTGSCQCTGASSCNAEGKWVEQLTVARLWSHTHCEPSSRVCYCCVSYETLYCCPIWERQQSPSSLHDKYDLMSLKVQLSSSQNICSSWLSHGTCSAVACACCMSCVQPLRHAEAFVSFERSVLSQQFKDHEYSEYQCNHALPVSAAVGHALFCIMFLDIPA